MHRIDRPDAQSGLTAIVTVWIMLQPRGQVSCSGSRPVPSSNVIRRGIGVGRRQSVLGGFTGLPPFLLTEQKHRGRPNEHPGSRLLSERLGGAAKADPRDSAIRPVRLTDPFGTTVTAASAAASASEASNVDPDQTALPDDRACVDLARGSHVECCWRRHRSWLRAVTSVLGKSSRSRAGNIAGRR